MCPLISGSWQMNDSLMRLESELGDQKHCHRFFDKQSEWCKIKVLTTILTYKEIQFSSDCTLSFLCHFSSRDTCLLSAAPFTHKGNISESLAESSNAHAPGVYAPILLVCKCCGKDGVNWWRLTFQNKLSKRILQGLSVQWVTTEVK